VTEGRLAIEGGPKAAAGLTSKPTPKIWVEEIEEILDLWAVKPDAKRRIRDLLLEDGMEAPHLFRYYGPEGRSKVEAFEAACREAFGVKHALGVNSGTSALIAAMVACEVGPGTEVIVPAYTFFATTAAVVVAKGIPVIAEVDETLGLDPDDVANKITEKTVALAPVHMGGMPCNMDALMELARKHKLRVIEDVAQAGGGTYKGRPLGTLGDMGCFSLDFYKTFVSGEGGIVITDDEWLYTRAQSYHDTAACWRPDRFAKERMPGELFCGENYRMSELHGAVALAQLRKLPERLRNWRRNKQRILNGIEWRDGVAPQPSHDPQGEAAYTLTFYASSQDLAGRISEALAAEGVGAGGMYSDRVRDWHCYRFWEHILEQKTATREGCPFTCPYHDAPLPNYTPDMCPGTLDLLSRAVRIGVAEWWTEGDCDLIAGAINKVLGAYLGARPH
jgi:8-amino-3,8-dideoxy-alpha-D-manno-octulosonate transaminase